MPPGPLRQRLRKLVAGCASSAAASSSGHPRLRILLTSEQPQGDLEEDAIRIKVTVECPPFSEPTCICFPLPKGALPRDALEQGAASLLPPSVDGPSAAKGTCTS